MSSEAATSELATSEEPDVIPTPPAGVPNPVPTKGVNIFWACDEYGRFYSDWMILKQ